MSLGESIAKLVKDNSSLSFSGMGGAQCVAHTYEVIRQGRKNITLIGDSPCEAGDRIVNSK